MRLFLIICAFAFGAITDSYTYDAFGSLISQSGTTPNDYLYAGEQWDANSGFYYLRARYMNPSNGRFLSMDSFEGRQTDPITLHKYLYANAQPVNFIDPSGNVSIAEVMIVVAIVAVVASMSACRPVTKESDVPTGQITHEQVRKGKDVGFYKDITIVFKGNMVREKYFVVQWVKGSFKKNGQPQLSEYNGGLNRVLDISDWVVDSFSDADAEYHQGSIVSPNLIIHSDTPGASTVSNPYREIKPGDNYEANLQFKTNLYERSKFYGKPTVFNFTNPSVPAPVVSIDWSFNDTWTVP